MTLLFLSYFAGILTILAPCVLPLLPIIIGSSISTQNRLKPYLVILGLMLSVTIFTIVLKASTILIDIDPSFWTYVSGGIVIAFGLIYIFPVLWDKVSGKLGLSSKSDQLLHQAGSKKGWIGDLLLGASLGPVFASCSPTYFLIIATVLPVNFFTGIGYIIVYALGLGTVMLAVAIFGRSVVTKLKFASNPQGWFKKGLGVLFIIVGISVITGLDKTISTNILNTPGIFNVSIFEQNILDSNLPQN